jgi:HSP90 family molecular chaperone
MSAHESNVNFRNLIRDLTEMYTYDVAEVVITELVANALDAKATTISVDYDPKLKTLVVSDNGVGMNSDQFKKYHDLAAGLKSRGTGIGFAGVGAKISFNIADQVITETRSVLFEGGSNWHLVRQNDGIEQLLWEDLPLKHLEGHGTRIEVDFSKEADIFFSTTNDLISLLRRHYLPLFIASWDITKI